MRHNGSKNGSLERRRRLVAAALVRKPTITQRQIQKIVADQLPNPETGEPYSLGTINNDIKAIRGMWLEKAGRDYDTWVAEEVARINEVEEEAWKRGELGIILQCSDRRRKLKGLDQPEKKDFTSGGKPLVLVNWDDGTTDSD